MTAYETYVLIHVLAAITWVGGALLTQVYAVRTLASKEPVRIAGFAKDIEWIGMRIFAPASLLLVVFGALAVHEGSLDFGDAWISIGMTVWLISFVSGVAFLGPESGRIGRLVEEHGAGAPVVQARIRRILLISRIELLLLVVVVWAMVTKPGI